MVTDHPKPVCLIAVVMLFLAVLLVPWSATAQVDTGRAELLPPRASSPDVSRQVVKSNVDLVLVGVTVLDHSDRTVTGLETSDFTVLEDSNRQTIRYLSAIDQPISLVIVFDASASMATKIQAERKAVGEIINNSNPQDEFTVIVVQSKPEMIFQSDDPGSDLQRRIELVQPEGRTALWDGLYLALNKLQTASYQRKAIVLISDGGNNHSRYTQSEIKSQLEEADVEVYALGIFDRFAKHTEEKTGPLQLDEVASVTGGRMFSVHDPAEISHAVAQINSELRNQYVLGYYSSNRDRNGKWRKLKVRLAGSAAASKLRLYARKGYYAPAD